MNEPIFIVSTASAASVSQYFKWESGVHDTFTLTDCSVERINGVYEYLSSATVDGNLREYYQNQGNSDMYIVICYSELGEVCIYFSEYTEDITTVDPWDYDLMLYYTSTNLFDEIYWQEPQITIDTYPTIVTTNAGGGLFSYKLDDGDWSTDAELFEYTLAGLADGSNHTFYVREQLDDETYGDAAECAFAVAFTSGGIQLRPEFAAMETDLTSVDIEFTFPSYDSKLLSGLTSDTLGVSGLYINCGTKNSASCYNNGDYYLWYSASFSRWLVTGSDYFNDDTGMYDYYESYLYADAQTDADTWADGTWYLGMAADMYLTGTPAWTVGVYNVIPLGLGIGRYRVDDGDYVELAEAITSFTLTVTLGNTYSVKISEQLDNGLWSPEVEIAIDCHLLAAPSIAAADGTAESDGGRNVAFEWSGAGYDVTFDGTSLQTPVFWDKSQEKPLEGYPDAATFYITNADTSASGSFCAVKLLPNTTYQMYVPWRDGNLYDAVYAPDLSTFIAQHDYEHAWEEIATGENGGLWIYAVYDQGSWGDWQLACNPAPEAITPQDIGDFYRMTTGGFCGTGTFRYHISSGPWSAEITDTRALQMFQLPTGSHSVYIEEKSSNSVWSATGTLEFSVVNGAEAGSSGGVTVPTGKFLVMLDPVTGKEYLWDGVASVDDLDPLTE